MNENKIISPDNKCFDYMGRIDFENPERPMFIWAGSNTQTVFTGKSLSVIVRNYAFQKDAHFGVVIDGVFHKIFLKNSTDDEIYTICDNLENGEHTLEIIKTLAGYNYFEFHGIIVDEHAKVRNPEHKYDLNIEVYGDSVSAGEVVEALYYEGQCDPPNHANKLDNSYYAYPQMLGRMLNARVHDNAQGGIALLDGTGWFNAGNLTGMESCYDKLEYVPYYKQKPWDFSRFTPDFVIFAIGQNDNHPDPDCVRNPEYRAKWENKYIEIIRDLMGKYPNAVFISLMTVLRHDIVWDDILDEICREINSERFVRFRFSRNAAATYGHPRATEQAEMATELAEFIRKIMA